MKMENKGFSITIDGYEIFYEDNYFKIYKDGKEVEVNFNNNSIWIREDNNNKVYVEY